MNVHRVRFIEHEPQPIHCLAFSDDPSSFSKLAVSRGDGSIEIWRSSDNECFYKDVWIPGRTDGSVEALVWCGGRLFTSGLTGVVLEWDLIRLRPAQAVDSFGGAVWCMQLDGEHSQLATGSEDGQVRLFDVSDNSFSFSRGLDKQEGRILSLAWHPDYSCIAVGGADSTIRKLDIKSGRCILRITMDEFKSRSTLVWDLRFLSDSTLVSADSLGKVQFWNSSHGTLIQAHSLHSADILSLAVSEDKRTLYSAGVDQKVVCLKQTSDDVKWVKTKHMRAHTHDIRALALSKSGILASGGVDTQLITCPTNDFDIRAISSHQPNLDSSQFFSVAGDANVLVHQSSMSLQFWQLSTQHRVQTSALVTESQPTSNGGREQSSPSASSVSDVRLSESESALLPHCTNGIPKNFLEIKCKGPQCILSSTVSPDAAYVALSTADRLWLYHIDHSSLSVRCLQEIESPCYKMGFTPDGRILLLATIDSGVRIVDTTTFDINKARPLQIKTKPHLPITHFVVSCDNEMVALSDNTKRVTICRIDSGDVLCKVPRLDSGLTLYTFSSSSDQLILFTGVEKQLYSFDITGRHLSVIGHIPLEKRQGRSKLSCPNGLLPVPQKEDLYAVYDSDCVVLVRGSKLREADKESTSKGKRKERSFEGKPLRIRFVTSSRGAVLYTGPFGGQELVLVERQWSDTLSKLPPALARNQYGT